MTLAEFASVTELKPEPEKIIEIFNIPGYTVIDNKSKLGELF